MPTLEEVCSHVVDCKNRTAPIDPSGEYFAVGTPAMRGNVINYGEARRINEETFVEWTSRLLPQEGDILFAREAPVGPVVAIPAGGKVAAGQRTMLFRTDPDKAYSDFLRLYLSAPETQARIIALAHGSTTPHLRVADVRSFQVNLPPLKEQMAIAEVLGALDDKIAANTKLSATGESLLAAEFHRRVQHVPYSSQTFGDIAKVSGGGTPSTAVPAFWNGQVLWATPTDVTGLQGPYLSTTSRRISEAGLVACASELYPEGAILMTSRATIGAFALAQESMAVNQGFIVVQPHDQTLRFWLFHEMRSRVDEFISLANGATFLELSRGNFKKFKVRLAEPQVMKDFIDLAGPIHAVAADALSENSKLSTIRDALLPQLMSGKLRVKDAEKVLEDAGV